MSQSKTYSGVHSPKDTARSRRVEHDNQPEETGDSDTVEPACRAREIGRGAERRKWRETPYNGRIRAFYEACEWCYPDSHPDDETETVVRSCREPTRYHRPRHEGEPCEQTDAPETDTDGTRISQDAIEPIGAISSLTDLQEGQRVVLESRKQPLRVIKGTSEPDGSVTLRGPSGGEYQIEGRPEYSQPYYIPKTGYLSEIIRVRVTIPVEAV
jgi:hypothetical protein